jgi:hypothetical protein
VPQFTMKRRSITLGKEQVAELPNIRHESQQVTHT